MDFDDDLEDNENIENEDQTTVTMDNNSPPKSGEDFFLTQQDFDAAHGGDAQNPNKRTRSNAKAVECLDMDGNHIKTFRSGIAAVRELGVPQGDISLCCRGLKDSISGYKFRFVVEEHRQNAALRRGYTTEPVPPAVPAVAKNSFDIPLNDEEFQGRLVTRLSRHRVDTEKDKQVKDSILAPAAMKVTPLTNRLKS